MAADFFEAALEGVFLAAAFFATFFAAVFFAAGFFATVFFAAFFAVFFGAAFFSVFFDAFLGVAFLADFLAAFLATFFTAVFAVFFADFFADFFAGVFLAAALVLRLLDALRAVFLAAVFLVAFFAVDFLTADFFAAGFRVDAFFAAGFPAPAFFAAGFFLAAVLVDLAARALTVVLRVVVSCSCSLVAVLPALPAALRIDFAMLPHHCRSAVACYSLDRTHQQPSPRRFPGCGRNACRKPNVTRIILFLIGLYKRLLSPLLGQRCRFYPSCSEYARIAVARFGPWRGGIMATWRILRCQPLCSGGPDPVPDTFHLARCRDHGDDSVHE